MAIGASARTSVLSLVLALGLAVLFNGAAPKAARAEPQDCGMISVSIHQDPYYPGDGGTQANLDSYYQQCKACVASGGTFWHDGGGGPHDGLLYGHCVARGSGASANAGRGYVGPGAGGGSGGAAPQSHAQRVLNFDRQLNNNANALMGMWAADQAQREAEQAQAAEAERERAAEREAEAERQREAAAAADARQRAYADNPFSGEAPTHAPDNPFLAGAAAAPGSGPGGGQAGGDNPFAVASQGAAPGASPGGYPGAPGGATDPGAQSQPGRQPDQLGDPASADGRETLSTAQCQARHGDVITLPNGVAYCTVGSQWFHLN